MKNLLVINGHPDPRPERFCGALSDAYESGARAGGWTTKRLNIGNLPLSSVEGERDRPSADIVDLVSEIEWANRLAIVFPLWFDQPPDVLCSVFHHVGSAIERRRLAHLVVTMEVPAFAYRSLLRDDAPKKALGFSLSGVVADDPVLIGCVNTISREQRRQWLATVRRYGERSRCGTAPPSGPRAFASAIDRTVSQWWNAI